MFCAGTKTEKIKEEKKRSSSYEIQICQSSIPKTMKLKKML